MSARGRFIVLDGPDGCGKSTQLHRLAAWLESQGRNCVRAKDPGGTPIGDRIRHVVLNFDLSGMDVRCETLLFMASRAQLVAQVIRPALDAGATVLSDRYISSTCAYQAAAGMPVEDVLALGKLAVRDCWPDLTLILDLPAEVGLDRTGRKPHHRASKRDGEGQGKLFDDAVSDAMERRPLEFHRAVRANFLQLAEHYPTPVRVVDGTGTVDEVFARVREAVADALE